MFFLRFYGHFAAGIGTCALLALPMALLGGNGEALVIALGLMAVGGIYAAVRMAYDVNTRLHARIADLEQRLRPAERQAA